MAIRPTGNEGKREMEKIALGLRDIFIHQHHNLTQEIKGKMNVLKY
jgi:hypothetical protein